MLRDLLAWSGHRGRFQRGGRPPPSTRRLSTHYGGRPLGRRKEPPATPSLSRGSLLSPTHDEKWSQRSSNEVTCYKQRSPIVSARNRSAPTCPRRAPAHTGAPSHSRG